MRSWRGGLVHYRRAWRLPIPTMPNPDHPLVLVLDDEAPIREIQRRILEKAGYRVIEASSGADAFTLLEGTDELALLIADLEMPDLTGEEVVRRIRLARPDLKVLYVTGHIDRLLDARSTLWEGEAFLDKPFTPRGLLEAVSLLLYGKLPKEPE
jgi:two-component system, cell cycle sensor histidine kinase and response regulator CckA